MEQHSPWQVPPDLWEKLRPLAQEMRRNPTPAEEKLWQRIRKQQVHGYKFRRQHSIERFIVDFYCHELKLVLEVDGSVHDTRTVEDGIRQEFLEQLGYQVLRFKNEDVFEKVQGVVEVIAEAVNVRASERQTPSLSPSPANEGGKLQESEK